ncbi:MAG: ATP-binding protein [Myxococcota bacterium]
MTRRLYLQVFAAFVAVLLVATAGAAGAVWLVFEDPHSWPVPAWVDGAAELVGERVADADDVTELSRRLQLDVRVWDAAGGEVGSGGRPLPAPDFAGEPVQRLHERYHGHAIAVELDDGRWLAVGAPWPRPRPVHGGAALAMTTFLGLLAAGSYLLARRVTRRLEALQRGVDAWGSGDLGRRVPVAGRDEVASLAASFNDAADRIEGLVDGQRRMLASASHELRSPLARVRMALELMDGDPAVRAGAERDVGELDELIGDLLLASRLEARAEAPRERVDLGALLAEEAARVGATATGAATVTGDPRTLRRMVRNLLENARRHGGADIAARLSGDALVVEDRGPGVPEAERERIFEPFYRPAGHREGADGGVGLGLALVRQIARHHGGDATCEAREGGGSRFVVTLPR